MVESQGVTWYYTFALKREPTKGGTLTVQEDMRFSYTLGAEVQPIITGKKLRSSNIRARQILVRPGRNISEKYWVVTKVSDAKDLDLVGELLIFVKPRPPLKEHETFVTVESGIRSGIQGSRNSALRSQLESVRSDTVVEVRQRLLDDWQRLLQYSDGRESQLLELIVSDMQLCRTLLRKDVRGRVEQSVGFLDSIGRMNPRANAARLTAAIARLRLQLEYDELTQKSLRYRYLNCTTFAETIAADIWDIQVLLKEFLSGKRVAKSFSAETRSRLERISIKPYFWAKVWIDRWLNTEVYSAQEARLIVEVLLAEQQLGEIDMLLSELKHSDKNQQRLVLRIITMTLSNMECKSVDYQTFFLRLRRSVQRTLAISKSTTEKEYSQRVEVIQREIRYRSQEASSPWLLDKDHLLIS